AARKRCFWSRDSPVPIRPPAAGTRSARAEYPRQPPRSLPVTRERKGSCAEHFLPPGRALGRSFDRSFDRTIDRGLDRPDRRWPRPRARTAVTQGVVVAGSFARWLLAFHK